MGARCLFAAESDVSEFLVLKAPIAIAIVLAEELLQVFFVYHDAHLLDSTLESGEVHFACLGSVEELKGLDEELLFVLVY